MQGSMNDEPQEYSLAVIRELLLAAFTPEDLRRFCQDRPPFRPVVAAFGPGHGFKDMVDRVIDYCNTHLLWGQFLAEVKRDNPRQYARFEAKILAPTAARPIPSSPTGQTARAAYPATPAQPAAGSYIQQADSRWRQGDFAGAIADYTRAIELDPQNAIAYNSRGYARSYQRDLTGAIADYTRAIELEPGWFDPYHKRSLACAQLGRKEQAIADLEKCLDLSIEPDFRKAIQRYLKQLKRRR